MIPEPDETQGVVKVSLWCAGESLTSRLHRAPVVVEHDTQRVEVHCHKIEGLRVIMHGCREMTDDDRMEYARRVAQAARYRICDDRESAIRELVEWRLGLGRE
jgi:hypothetical protein